MPCAVRKENMMYQDKFVVAIKVGGKILRETKDLVHLPFGSEFSVLVKNLNSRRAKFTLHIDGQDALSGSEIIVNANAEIEMRRFIRNGNMNEGNAFKFIERTQSIEDGPRGIKIDDGVIRVEFWFEQEAPKVTTTYHKDIWWNEHYPSYVLTSVNPYYKYFQGTSGSITQNTFDGSTSDIVSSIARGVSANMVQGASYSSNAAASNSVSMSMDNSTKTLNVPEQNNDVGITVPGSKVEQKFHMVYGFNSENISNVIILKLAGTRGAVQVAAPITVKSKQKCETCGHMNKANAKFCGECGTGLELV